MRSLGGGLLALGIAVLIPSPGVADQAACAQARAIVTEVEGLYQSGAPDHNLILSRLKTARDLCATLGPAWKYSFCSASALGDEKGARLFRDRAVLNDVSDLACPAGGKLGRQAPTAAPLGPVHTKYALVIGIGRFQDPQINQLQFPAKDARDLAAVLTDPRYGRFDPRNVTLLTDEKATRKNILNALQELFLRAQEDDLVFLYVSSHGSPHREESGLGGVGYIVTYDTAVKSIWVDALEYDDFSRKVSLLKARRKAIFLDTCYSGQVSRANGEKGLLVEAAGLDPGTARLFLSGEGTYVVTSSRATEKSFESESLHNGYFTYYLMAALKQGGAPQTVKEIFSLLAHDVPAAVAREKNQSQHPQILPADGPGDLRIGVASLSEAEGRP
jgi:hypothetical protein